MPLEEPPEVPPEVPPEDDDGGLTVMVSARDAGAPAPVQDSVSVVVEVGCAVCEPEVGTETPLMVQAVALETAQETFEEPPEVMVVGDAVKDVMDTAAAGGTPTTKVLVSVPAGAKKDSDFTRTVKSPW